MWVGPRVFEGMKFDRIMAGLMSLSQLLYVECNRTPLRLQGSFLIGKIWITTFTLHYTSKETCKQTSLNQGEKKKNSWKRGCLAGLGGAGCCDVKCLCGAHVAGNREAPQGAGSLSPISVNPREGLGRTLSPRWDAEKRIQWSSQTPDPQKLIEKCIGLNHLCSW